MLALGMSATANAGLFEFFESSKEEAAPVQKADQLKEGSEPLSLIIGGCAGDLLHKNCIGSEETLVRWCVARLKCPGDEVYHTIAD